MSRNTSLTRHIQDFFKGLGQPCEASEILDGVVKRLLKASANKRRLSSDALASIRKSFKDIPGGRRRAVHRGLEQCLLYLEQVCQWELPESKVPRYQDHKQQWMIKLFEHAQLGSAVHEHYQAQKVNWIHTRAPLCASEVILVLSMEVAPLPLSIWLDVLSNSSSIEKLDGQFTVRFDHPNQTLKSGEVPSFTRYALTPFACRVLWNYYQTHSDQTRPSKTDGAKKRSPVSLKREIYSTIEYWNAWIAPLSAHYEFAPLINALDPKASDSKHLKVANWHCIFQIIWHCAYGYPSELLRDHAVPDRHVAFEPPQRSSKQIETGFLKLYEKPNVRASNKRDSSGSDTKWPHKALLKRIKKEPRDKVKSRLMAESDPVWPMDNVLPTLLELVTRELIIYGGEKVENLAPASLDKYTGIESLLKEFPLSYERASDPEALQLWARTVYDSLKTDNHRDLMRRFFRYLPHIALTEDLDITEFDSPNQPLRVDAFRITPEHLDSLIHALLNTTKGTPFQKLCAVVAAVLGLYGGLRRGEVLRLRWQDVIVLETHRTLFCLHITHTKEGQTKNKCSRNVHMALPENLAEPVHQLLDLKAHLQPNLPLIGFVGESMHSRQETYLYPVTQALKALFGHKTRFHHLRHSGAHLLLLQALALACSRARSMGVNGHLATSTSELLLSKEFCHLRFEFWLEGRAFSQMNGDILLDVTSNELGHQYFAITRRSYLHGVEWVPAFFSDTNKGYDPKELRYVLGLSPNAPVPELTQSVASSNTRHYEGEGMAEHISTNGMVNLGVSGGDNGKAQSVQDGLVSIDESTLVERMYKGALKHSVPALSSALPEVFQVPMGFDFLKLWQAKALEGSQATYKPSHRSLPQPLFHWQTPELFQALSAGEESFKAISQFEKLIDKHEVISLSKSQLTALQALGPIKPMPDKLGFTLQFDCNQRNAKAFNEVFRSSLFRAYSLSFHLTQNRKQSPDRKLALIREHYAKGREPISTEKCGDGPSQFEVRFQFIPKSPMIHQTIINFLTQGVHHA